MRDRIREAQNAHFLTHRRVYAKPNVAPDVKNSAFYAAALSILTCGVSNFDLPRRDKRTVGAQSEFLVKKLLVSMGKPRVDRNLWITFPGYHRSDLGNPNFLEWVHAKRLRALFRAVDPTLKITRDPESQPRARHLDLTRTSSPRFYDALLYGIDPLRDRGRPDATPETRKRNQN